MPARQRKQKKIPRNLQTYVKKQIGKAHMTKIFQVDDEENSLASTVKAQVVELSQMSLGQGDNDRLGGEIRAFGIHLNYIILSSGVSVTIPQYVRVVLISCNEDDFTAITDLFIQGSAGNPTALTANKLIDIISPLNVEQFNILYDRTHKLEGQAEGMGQSSVKVKKYIKINHNRRFNGEGVGDTKNNNLRWLIFNREIDNDTNTVTCEWSLFSRYYFKDD